MDLLWHWSRKLIARNFNLTVHEGYEVDVSGHVTFGIRFSHCGLSQDVVFSTCPFCRSVVSMCGKEDQPPLWGNLWSGNQIRNRSHSITISCSAADTKISAPSAKKRKLQKAVSLKPEEGPNIALHALSTNRKFAFQINVTSLFHSTSPFSILCRSKVACVVMVKIIFRCDYTDNVCAS